MPSEEIPVEGTDLVNDACVVIVTYNHEEYIEECLERVLANDPGDVIVVDSASTDSTIATVESEFPDVDVIECEQNVGYGSGNNLGMDRVEAEYVVVLNPDTRLRDDCLDELLQPLSEDERLITTPKILTYDGESINTIGITTHFSGLSSTRGFKKDPDAYSQEDVLTGVSGVCFATTREVYQELGGFEDEIFLYMDDVELSWKAAAADVEIRYVPTATVLHDYPGANLDAGKLFHLERGRYLILRKYLGAKGAALVLPSLLVTEILTWGYAILQGPAGVRAKFRAATNAFSTTVTPVDVDVRELVEQLDDQIPAEDFPIAPVFRGVIRLANKCYRTNISLLCK
ncbi:glycosyltransferase family 2 protein [Haloarcula nitratireducens]|uniref:Glycosyltransferase family 2 protein n=1 Tax=Haloarcula nitratireducens TaxID=2487749 RepID=A0AAW4PH38_9EURY|nr:glycosyltransferase family 2 protein [Halomicroarcula nitratireducens]MBX0297771.1 glycosyltransferase family 2 protein [Halomicroarcula nitratireducens]